ncbi:unnamed protein product, partial [Iphiclides podalirius]
MGRNSKRLVRGKFQRKDSIASVRTGGAIERVSPEPHAFNFTGDDYESRHRERSSSCRSDAAYRDVTELKSTLKLELGKAKPAGLAVKRVNRRVSIDTRPYPTGTEQQVLSRERLGGPINWARGPQVPPRADRCLAAVKTPLV